MSSVVQTHEDGSSWIHTGDIGRIDEEGFIFIEGRTRRMIVTVSDGVAYKIIPDAVERVLSRNRHVRECCVVGCEAGKDLGLKAFVATNDNIPVDELERELRQLCNQALGENQRPHAYEVLAELPRTAAGKVDYRNLEKRA